ncbi:MAG: AMP-binding protein [Chloroflexota bacterium]|nr:AMP-binding protein [Chloroflexota bacterium]
MTTADTLPKLLLHNYQKWGEKKVSMRKKEFGIWREYTWKDCYEKVKFFSLGMISLGFERGDRISILGDNNPQWFWAELAAMAAGGSATGIFSDCLPTEVKHIAEHSDSRFVVAQDQEQIDKLLQIKDELPLVEKVIYWDPKGMWDYEDSIIVNFDEILGLGEQYAKSHPDLFEENISKGKGEDLAVVLYTSGTTGLPKGAMISYDNLIRWTSDYLLISPAKESDDYFSYILPGWVAEQMFGLVASLIRGQVLNFPEQIGTAPENIVEISPTVHSYPVPLWERLISQVQVKISDASFLKRTVYHLFVPVGYRIADTELEGKNIRLFWKTLYALGGIMVFRPLKSRHGLHRVRLSLGGGALMGPDSFRFIRGFGIKVKIAYAITEAGIIAGHLDELDPGTVGVPVEGVEVSAEGEIIVPRDKCFMGYLKNSEATEKAFAGGYYHTGDAGYKDEKGHLVFWDRISDLKQLRNGAKFSPQFIETKLRFSPLIEDAVVTGGEDKDFVGSLITIDYGNVGNWMEKRNIPYTTFTDASQKPEVYELIQKEVEKVNRTLPEGARIHKFVNLHKALDPDDAELTRTKKVRRDFLERHYAELIDIIYGDVSEKIVEAPVTYRDGRKGILKTTIKVNYVN